MFPSGTWRFSGLAACAVIFFGGGLGANAADQTLLFHAESLDGEGIAVSQGADRSFNPASVIKVATSLLALETLGPDHRYVTEFGCRGPCTIDRGRLQGDLVISGGADPDFQAENAWLVAHELSRLGISKISGDLLIEGVFFQGWEHGVEKRQTDALRRARLMGDRFRQALDAAQWDTSLRATWEDAAPRHGWSEEGTPRISIDGTNRLKSADCEEMQPLIRHRSNPLGTILRRFNTYSNNDIIRIADPIGGPEAVEALLENLAGDLPGEIQVSTASGERVNRLTARQVVRLLRAFDETCRELNLDPSDILPVPGCVQGSLPRMFPRLATGENSRTAVVKSGTLTTTDGGVAVLAGFFRSLEGETVAFCVGALQAGGRLKHFRLAEQNWLLDLMRSAGGADHQICGTPLAFSDTMAEARVIGRAVANKTHGESNAAK